MGGVADLVIFTPNGVASQRVVGGEVGVVFSITVPYSGQGADISRVRQARFRDEELRLAGFCWAGPRQARAGRQRSATRKVGRNTTTG